MSILAEAEALTSGDRNDAYGSPSSDWICVGRLWGAMLTRWLHSHHPEVLLGRAVPDLPPEVALLMMQGVKISRELHKPRHDTRVDGVGYWVCEDMVIQERATQHLREQDHQRLRAHLGLP